jgi:hypothetical protein
MEQTEAAVKTLVAEGFLLEIRTRTSDTQFRLRHSLRREAEDLVARRSKRTHDRDLGT